MIYKSNSNEKTSCKKIRDWVRVDKMSWYLLSSNQNAIELLTANQKKIKWNYLISNTSAIELLKIHKNKISWDYLHMNPAIFTYDYDLISKKNKDLNEEIIQKALHPKRMLRLMAEYGEDEIYNCYFNND